MRFADWRLGLARRVRRHHPGVRSDDELSVGERAADRLRNGRGSWDHIPAESARHDDTTNLEALDMIGSMEELTAEIHRATVDSASADG